MFRARLGASCFGCAVGHRAPWRTASPVPTCSAWVWAEPCHPFRPRPPQSASVGVPGPSRPPVRPPNQCVCLLLTYPLCIPGAGPPVRGEGPIAGLSSDGDLRRQPVNLNSLKPSCIHILSPPGALLLSLGARSHTCAFLSKQATRSKPDGEAEAEAEMGRVRAGGGGPAVRPAGRRVPALACPPPPGPGDGVSLSSGQSRASLRGALGWAAPLLPAARGPGVVS